MQVFDFIKNLNNFSKKRNTKKISSDNYYSDLIEASEKCKATIENFIDKANENECKPTENKFDFTSDEVKILKQLINDATPLHKSIKKYIIINEIKHDKIVTELNNKFPEINISQPFVSKALAGKYPSMLEKIHQLIKGGNL